MDDQTPAQPNDELLMERLRDLSHRHDPVPPEVASAARASFIWRTVDAELALLSYDSVLDDDRLVGVRGGGEGRLLTFEGPGLSVEVQATEGRGGTRRLVGQLVPPRQAVLEIRHPDGSSDASADELGRFTVEAVPAGPVSLKVTIDDTVVETDWVTL